MRCSVCGKEHPLESLELTFQLPDDAAALSEQEQSHRVQANEDLCAIDGQRFFVRAVLPLAVEARDRPYNIGLWVEVELSAIKRIGELWKDPNQSDEPPFEVRISNAIPSVDGSLGANASLHLTGPTTRPSVTVAPACTRIYEEQVSGITVHRASEYSAFAAPEV